MNLFPQVSIILPTYNGARYLALTIESCLAQTSYNWELIIVDDASTDATPEIIAHYCALDARLRTIRHEVNRKLPAALNTGFSLAQGELLTWISDDNRFCPEALSRMVDFSEKHPDVDIVYTDYISIDEEGHSRKIFVVQAPEHIVDGNIVGPSFLYRQKVQSFLSGYDEQMFLVEDYDFWLRASEYFKFAPLHEVLYEYRIHKHSLSVKYLDLVKSGRRKTLRKNIMKISCISSRQKAAGWINLAAFAHIEGDQAGLWHCLFKAFCSCSWITILIAAKILFLRRKINYECPVRLPHWLL